MKTRLYTWAVTFGWPPRWPFARLWATEGDPDDTIRTNAKALEEAGIRLRRALDDNARFKRGK